MSSRNMQARLAQQFTPVARPAAIMIETGAGNHLRALHRRDKPGNRCRQHHGIARAGEMGLRQAG